MIKIRLIMRTIITASFFTTAVCMAQSLTDSNEKTALKSSVQSDKKNQISNESYWVESCSGDNAKRRCNLTLELKMKDTDQQVLLAGLTPDSKGRITGNFTLPFGLDVSKGISVTTDSPSATVALPFKTCLPQGCIVPVRLDEMFVKKMQRSKAMKLKATLNDGHPVVIDIPLQGFSEKLRHLPELNKGA